MTYIQTMQEWVKHVNNPKIKWKIQRQISENHAKKKKSSNLPIFHPQQFRLFLVKMEK